MKRALIDVGGGMRGAYSAGVLDAMLEDDLFFDWCIGVSAGSGNLASYAAGQKGRNYDFYLDYPRRRQYMSLSNYARNKSFFDMDYIYSTLTNEGGENPLDLDSLRKRKMKLITVATNALSGKPAYFGDDMLAQDDYDIFKASCSIPVVNQPYFVKGIPFCDGTVPIRSRS